MKQVVAQVTQDIIERSKKARGDYLANIDAAKGGRVSRSTLSCGNLAHGFAACSQDEKDRLTMMDSADVAIVSSYNDMLSAHQPFENYPQLIKQAVRDMGSVAQFAGGVPAMCDGVTQGQPGMELSLFSRDVISMSTAVALSHNMFDAVLCLGVCDKIVPRAVDWRFNLWPFASGVCASRSYAIGFAKRRKSAHPPVVCGR